MSCKKFNEKLIAAAFGESELTPELRAHIAECPNCRREMSLYRLGADGMKELPAAPEPRFSNERLREAILSREIAGGRPWVTRIAWAGAACAVLVASWLTVGRGIFSGVNAPEPLASLSGAKPNQPLGPITIPETSPVLPKVSPEVKKVVSVPKAQSLRRTHRVKRVAPVDGHGAGSDELMAMATGGAAGAVRVSESPQPAVPTIEPAIIVIDPDDSRAMERDSSDVSIGG